MRNEYTKTIRLACQKHGIPHWHLNQLRHGFATRLRWPLGLEAAQVLLGPSRADATPVYAESNAAIANEAIHKNG